MIVSTVSGRLRVRSKQLKSKRFLDDKLQKIKTLPSVIDARGNRGAGSIIVSFDTEKVAAEDLEEKIEAICFGSNKSKSHTSLEKNLNRATKVGMVSTLAASVVYGFAGKKKPHIGYGVAFVGLAGLHMMKHANRLFRG